MKCPDLTRVPEPYWMASTPQTDYPALDKDLAVDVAIIGGGLVGISTAWMLKKEGLKVAVLEADRICQGTTEHSTAKITSQHGLIYDKVIKQFGKEPAKQYAEANQRAIQVMADIIEEYNIDCDFQWMPAYIYTQQDRYVQPLQDEAKVAESLGIKAQYLEKLDLPFPVKGALSFEGQAQFHPRKYTLALAEVIPGDGCHIFEQSKVVALEEGDPHQVVVRGGIIVSAHKVVVASHFPIHDGLGFYFARMYPDRSYVLGVKTKDKLPEGMYVTAESPGRSLRTQPYIDEELILVGGEHHKTGHGEGMMNHYEILRDFACNSFDVVDIPFRWSTQDYTTMDKIPYIGHIRSGVSDIYVATGFKKWGISTSTVSALMIRDLIVKGESPWDIFAPSRRTTLKAGSQLIMQNIEVAQKLVSGKLKNPSHKDVEPGQGKIVRVDGQRVGAYRDDRGNLHMVDITCTHFGCELEWNSAEKTWDCPCHGSRFTYEGDIVEGPAVNPLKQFSHGSNDIDPDII